MAKGKLRIRQRGSRQQWAQARSYKAFGPDESEPGTPADPSEPAGPVAAPPLPTKPLSGADVMQTLRCGLCGLIAEQKLRDGRTVVLIPYALCISCDEVRCHDCWDSPDDGCADADEHEFLEIRHQAGGAVQVADFATWTDA